jgi:hypothetical protein
MGDGQKKKKKKKSMLLFDSIFFCYFVGGEIKNGLEHYVRVNNWVWDGKARRVRRYKKKKQTKNISQQCEIAHDWDFVSSNRRISKMEKEKVSSLATFHSPILLMMLQFDAIQSPTTEGK